MQTEINSRKIILQLLMDINEAHVPAHLALSETLCKYEYLDKQTRAFISRVTRGTLEYGLQLEYVLSQYSKVKPEKMKPVILQIMKMSLYQMLYMDSVPDSAACNEAVKLAKSRGFKQLSGFVNGVLRQISREKDSIVWPDEKKQPVKFLSVKYSLPEWLVQMWLKQYDYAAVKAMAADMLAPRPVTIRVRGGRTAALMKSLQAQGVRAEAGALLSEALRISAFDHLNALPEFLAGEFTVQDESTMLAALAAGVKPGDRIIDVCAAPGGKSMHMADLLKGEGHISARDLTPNKCSRIQENISRLGLEKVVEVMTADARIRRESDIGTADIVMADLPCSGLGVIGRKADIKYTVKQEDITVLAALQREILTAVSQYVRPGGVLIYSTCTVAEAENQENIRWFQENFPFEAESLNAYLPSCMHSPDTENGFIQLLPGMYGCDGFFISRFRKKPQGE